MKKLLPLIAFLVLFSACTTAQSTTAPSASPAASETSRKTEAAPSAPASLSPTAAVSAGAPQNGPVLNILTHDSFSATEGLIQNFEKKNGVKLNFLKGGDVGAALNKAILTKDNPIADVFYGVDNTFLSRALDASLFEPYKPAGADQIDPKYLQDTNSQVVPVDYGDVCINYDIKYFNDKKLAVPQSLEDLTKPDYKGALVVENPVTSSPGLAFLLATIDHFGQDKYLDYWKALKDNGLVIVSGWEAAYYTNFSGSSGKGAQPMVLSYASSPAVEVYYASPPITEAPTSSLIGPGMCFRQIEYAGILKGAKNRAMAEKFIDYMLSQEFQEDIPLQMYVYPVNKNAKLPDLFVKFARTSPQPVIMDAKRIAANRDQWLKDWTEKILR